MSGTYESVHYPGQAHPQTHPDRLATLATLFGLKPAPVESCRVLELGCGDGLNLVPMAAGLPQSEFLGLDLAEKPLEHGRSAIAALGLKNLTLRALDLLQAPADLGQFDYIVAHGLYAWVPPEVRDKALALCRAHLAPQGVAYVSYNAYPGSHLREMVREMMLFQIRTVTDPDQQVEEAMGTLRFLASGFPENHTWGSFLRTELEAIRQRPRSHFFHDELGDIFAPVYFCEFVAHAKQHGLQYLAEADAFDQPEPAFNPPVAEHLAKLEREGRVIDREQMLDFLRCQRFRRTLLCHEQVRPNRALRPAQLAGFRLAGLAGPVSPQPDLASDAPEEFRGPRGLAVAVRLPVAKAALLHLSQIAPRALPWRDLVQAANARLGRAAPRMEDTTRLGEFLWKCLHSGLIELRLREPAFATEVSTHPVASPLARWQIRHGETATNALHEDVRFREPHFRRLLGLLDGTRDQAALLQAMTEAGPGDASRDKDAVVRALPELQKTLASLARHAVLVA